MLWTTIGFPVHIPSKPHQSKTGLITWPIAHGPYHYLASLIAPRSGQGQLMFGRWRCQRKTGCFTAAGLMMVWLRHLPKLRTLGGRWWSCEVRGHCFFQCSAVLKVLHFESFLSEVWGKGSFSGDIKCDGIVRGCLTSYFIFFKL